MPDTTVAAIITSVDSGTTKVLLTRRNIEPYKGRWSLPGGHIDQYESVRDAVIREVKEETGLGFDARFFGYFDEIIPERDIHAVVMVFEGPGAGTLTPSEDEVADAEWFPVERAQRLPLAFTHNEILRAYSLQHLTRGTSA